MMFRNLIAKPRKEKAKKDGEPPLIQPTQIGNDIVNIEAMRYQLRTQVTNHSIANFRLTDNLYLLFIYSLIETLLLIFIIKSKCLTIFSGICPSIQRIV